MANHASTKKRIRKTVRQTETNRNRLSRLRTSLRRVEEAIAGGNKAQAEAAFSEAQPQVMRGAQRKVLKANTASRKISRLSHRIKAMSA